MATSNALTEPNRERFVFIGLSCRVGMENRKNEDEAGVRLAVKRKILCSGEKLPHENRKNVPPLRITAKLIEAGRPGSQEYRCG